MSIQPTNISESTTETNVSKVDNKLITKNML